MEQSAAVNCRYARQLRLHRPLATRKNKKRDAGESNPTPLFSLKREVN